jgi:hypothetical protein
MWGNQLPVYAARWQHWFKLLFAKNVHGEEKQTNFDFLRNRVEEKKQHI